MAIYDWLVETRAREGIGDRIRRQRKKLGWSQIELSRIAKVNQGYLSEIERGRRRPSKNTLNALAVALDLPQAVIVGEGEEHDNPQPLELRHLPMFGSIPAGPPSTSQEQLQLFPVLRNLWSPDHYCLRLTFDSMEPTLKPGDVVLVHYRPDVDPELVQGRICACLVDGQPTLKRPTVDARQGETIVILRGDNPNVEPIIVDSARDFTIQGVVTTLVARDL